MMRLGKKWVTALTLSTLVGTVLLTAGPASARNNWTYWQPSSAPLTATKNGAVAYGYGNFSVADTVYGLKAAVLSYTKKSGGERGTYINAVFQANAGQCVSGSGSLGFGWFGGGISSSCSQQFYNFGGTRRGDNVTTTTYTQELYVIDPDWRATNMRARVQVCVDSALQTDACSGWGLSGFDSY